MRLDRKNKFLLLGFALSLYVSYVFAIFKTIGYYHTYKMNAALISSNVTSPKAALALHQKEMQLDQVLAHYNFSNSESFQNDLLTQLNDYSVFYHLKIVDFREPHVILNQDTATTSYLFSLEGSFNGCLALLNKIENNATLGNIQHLDFVKKRDYKSNRDYLVVDVVLVRSRG